MGKGFEKTIFGLWLPLTIFLILFPSITFADGREETAFPHRDNGKERVFHYTARKWGMPALKATLSIGHGPGKEERSHWKIEARVTSLSLPKIFFRMNNRFASLMETEPFTSIRYVKEIDQEGLFIQKKQYSETITFDPLRHKAMVEKKGSGERREVFFPSEAYDPLAIFARYHLKEGLPTDRDIRFSIFDGVRFRQLLFQSKSLRFSSKILGEVEAILLESSLAFHSFGDKEGVLRIWYTADRHRIPICLELDLPIGPLRFELEEIREG
ncbi:MAG: DUF3108 domain-containing protein [Desulfobacterota bacterium]|nr:DUF3108 domain-containing protein [Thermodesulfobacteriota bacterium]